MRLATRCLALDADGLPAELAAALAHVLSDDGSSDASATSALECLAATLLAGQASAVAHIEQVLQVRSVSYSRRILVSNPHGGALVKHVSLPRLFARSNSFVTNRLVALVQLVAPSPPLLRSVFGVQESAADSAFASGVVGFLVRGLLPSSTHGSVCTEVLQLVQQLLSSADVLQFRAGCALGQALAGAPPFIVEPLATTAIGFFHVRRLPSLCRCFHVAWG